MPARLTLRDQEYEVRSGMTIRAALLKIGILPETVIPTRDGELVTDNELLEEGEHIRLVAVISGGTLANHRPRTTFER